MNATGGPYAVEASNEPSSPVARSILVIVWHLLNDPEARYVDLGPDYYTSRLDPDRKTRDLVRQLQALGHNVALTPAA